MKEDAPQREQSLREVFNGLRYMVRSGGTWRMLPHDLPPWDTVFQQTQRSLAAGGLEAIVDDLRMGLRVAAGHSGDLDGHKHRKGSKNHRGVDTLGLLLA